jgi:hypothetical protein
MAKHENFYENLNEARLRLCGSVVCYEGKAYRVVEVAEHTDGKLRIYIDPIGPQHGWGRDKWPDFPSNGGSNSYNPALSKALDVWIDANPNSGVLRRYMSASGFNKYRPFPLGNMNFKGSVIYVERTPTRSTSQGLRDSGLVSRLVNTVPTRTTNSRSSKMISDPSLTQISMYCPEFADMVSGVYPTFHEVVENLRNFDVMNEGAAFHREFSVLRGPVETLCLCHKTDGVGLINDDNSLVLGRQFKHLVETVTELGVFSSVTIR